jgi:hypothetical protein
MSQIFMVSFIFPETFEESLPAQIIGVMPKEKNKEKQQLEFETIEKLLYKIDVLSEVYVYNIPISSQQFPRIFSGKNLSKVFFMNCSLSDSHIEKALPNKSIHEIVFHRETLSEKFLAFLAKNNMDTIYLVNSEVNASGFQPFKEHKKLNKIFISGCNIFNGNVLRELGKIPSLNTLYLLGCHYSEKLDYTTLKNKTLQELNISNDLINTEDIICIINSSIQAIHFDCCCFEPIKLNIITLKTPRNHSVQALYLSGCKNSGNFFTFLNYFAHLKFFKVDDYSNPFFKEEDKKSNLTENDLLKLLDNTSLESLQISSDAITDTVVAHLQSSDNHDKLQSLYFESNNISNEGAKQIALLPCLIDVTVDSSMLGKEGAKAILEMEKPTKISIYLNLLQDPQTAIELNNIVKKIREKHPQKEVEVITKLK